MRKQSSGYWAPVYVVKINTCIYIVYMYNVHSKQVINTTKTQKWHTQLLLLLNFTSKDNV